MAKTQLGIRTADDLALFAKMMLNGAMTDGARILQPATLAAMITRQQAPNGNGWWGLGWEVAPSFNSNGHHALPTHSFGHGGYTGTSIWIKPDSKTYVIILTNWVHPRGQGDVRTLRSDVLRAVAGLLVSAPDSDLPERRPESVGGDEAAISPGNATGDGGVLSGIDELTAQAPLKGLRVVIQDRTALDSPALGVELASALHRLYGGKFQLDHTLGMIGSRRVIQAIKDGVEARTITRGWTAALEAFHKIRARYLLYPTGSKN